MAIYRQFMTSPIDYNAQQCNVIFGITLADPPGGAQMRSVSAAQSQLQKVSIRSHGGVMPASTPIAASVVPAVHGPAESLGVAVGSGRRAIVLAVCCSALFMVGLDNTIVNVGLPEIGRSLHTSVAGLQWTVAGYTIVLASLLMFSGAAADRIGRRTIFQVGL